MIDNYCYDTSVEEISRRVGKMEKSTDDIFKKKHNVQMINVMKMTKTELLWN